jgi:hypothetical protein
MTDAVNEIKSNLKPSFFRPYLWVSVQKMLRLRGLYDTGADSSCMSEKVFRQLPLNARPKKLDSDKPQKFKSAGGEPLPVRGLYECNLRIGDKILAHQFYVIPELNEPLILGIDFIQEASVVVLPKKSFLCVGRPAQLGARPPQSLQCHRHSALVSGLPESLNPH